MIKKMHSFSHIELLKEPFINASYIAASILCGFSYIRRQYFNMSDNISGIEEFSYFDDERLKFLGEVDSVRDFYLARRSAVEYFMKNISCIREVNFSSYGIY
jgi:hypothetical protein